MQDNHDKHSIRSRSAVCVVAAALVSLSGGGCIETCLPPANANGELRLKGILLDVESSEGLSGVDIDAVLITNGETTTRDTHAFPTGAEGDFLINLTAKGPACQKAPDLPTPDQVRVIVPLEGCTQNFTFDVNEENFVDPEFNDRVLELKSPILVPACEE